jgi:hypothetical protein
MKRTSPIRLDLRCITVGMLAASLSCGAPSRDRSSVQAGASAGPQVPSPIVVARETRDSSTDWQVPFGPYLLEGQTYSVLVQRYIVPATHDTTTRRVQAVDAAGRVVYDENVDALGDGDADSWIDVSPSVRTDDSGRAMGFIFRYSFYPSAPGTGEHFRLIAMHGGVAHALTPLVTYFGDDAATLHLASPRAVPLHDSSEMVIRLWRGNYGAMIRLHLDFACAPGSDDCLRIVKENTIGEFSRFPVEAQRTPADSALGVDLFNRPGAEHSERIVVAPGDHIEYLDAAAHVFWLRSKESQTLTASDDWLHLRINGREGWVDSRYFEAVGLASAG